MEEVYEWLGSGAVGFEDECFILVSVGGDELGDQIGVFCSGWFMYGYDVRVRGFRVKDLFVNMLKFV